MTPNEDAKLYFCPANEKHEWVDLYGGAGASRYNPRVGLNAFFCKWCLEIRVRSWSQTNYQLSKQFLDSFGDNEEPVGG